MSNKNLRSTSNSSSEQGDEPITPFQKQQAEVQVIMQQLNIKENQLKEQTAALQQQQRELESSRTKFQTERNAAVDINSLTALIHTLKQDITGLKELPEQMRILEQKIIELRVETMQSDNVPPFSPLQREVTTLPVNPSTDTSTPPAHVPTHSPINSTPVRIKDIIDSIPKYDGHKMSVFQFCKVCERALKLIPSWQEEYLLPLVVNKLQGHAYAAIEGMECRKLTD